MRRKVGGRTASKKARVSGVKKHHHKPHRKGRRVSGMNDTIEKAAGLVGGAVIAREANTLISNFVTLPPLLSGAMQVVGGMMMPKLIKGKWGEYLGDGMIANGGMVMVVSTGIISGANDRMAYTVNGTSNIPVINGTANLPVVNGNRIQNTQVNRQISGTRIQNSVQPMRPIVMRNTSPQQYYV